MARNRGEAVRRIRLEYLTLVIFPQNESDYHYRRLTIILRVKPKSIIAISQLVQLSVPQADLNR